MHALLLSMALVSAGQDKPDFHRGLEKSSFKVQLSDRAWAECTLEYIYAGKSPAAWEEPCSRLCQGEKHFRHQDCDTSCDSPCFQEVHSRVGRAFTASGGRIHYETLARAMTAFGSASDPSVVTAYVERRNEMAKDANDVTYNWDHWNETPCSTLYRRTEADEYDIFFTFALFRHDLTADGRMILVTGPKHRTAEGKLVAMRNEFTMKEPEVSCVCEPEVTDGVPEDTQVGGIFLGGDSGMRPITGGEVTGIGLEVACTSMTECTATVTNPTLGDATLIIQPGTVYECVDGSAQDEVSCQRMVVKLGAGQTKTVPLALDTDNLFATVVQTVKGRFACMNMNKEEPRAGLKYRYGGAARPDVTALAFKTASSSIKGVPDQVRMWIVTDKATWKQVGELLIPAPSRGMYVNCLYDVETTTRKPLTDPAFRACIDPANIVGSRAHAEATDWFVDLWSGLKPAEFRSALGGLWDELKADCFDPAGEARDEQHAADLANSLAYSSAGEIRGLAADCLLKGVPAEKRGAIAGMGGLRGISVWLSENDAELAGKALDVLEAYRDKGTGAALLNCHEELPKAVKDRAAKLYAELS